LRVSVPIRGATMEACQIHDAEAGAAVRVLSSSYTRAKFGIALAKECQVVTRGTKKG